MKKIFVLFLLCFTVLSNNAFADDPWGQRVNTNAILNVIKTSNIKQYMNRDKFLDYIEKHWAPTFQDLLDACIVSVSQDTRKNCETFFFDVVKEHNRLVDENVETYTQGASQEDNKTVDDLRQQRSDNRKEKIRHLRRNPGAEFTDAELKLYDEANVYAGAAVRRYMALVQYRDASGNLKKGDRTKLVMYDCDVNANMCGFTFVGEKSGVNALACCHNIRNSGATCSLPYTWRKGDVEHTSVSDCR